MQQTFRVVREEFVDDQKIWVCVEHHEKAFAAHTAKELHEELNQRQRFEVQLVLTEPCELCGK